MKGSKLIKLASAGVLSLGLTAIPFSIAASAQDTTVPNATTFDVEDEDVDVEDAEDGFDWGLLGLLGLLGLAGLAGKKRDEVHRHHTDHAVDRIDPTPVNHSTSAPTSPSADAPRYRDPYRDPK